MRNIKSKSVIRLTGYFLKGFAIGSIDVIPGISGGTVALMLGIYEKIINSVSDIEFGIMNFVSKKREQSLKHFNKVNWNFIIFLTVGILTALFIGANLISMFLDKWPHELRSLFLGLVLGSIIVPWSQIKTKNILTFLLLLFSMSLAFWIMSISYSTKISPNMLWIILAGLVSVSAMILPGISGAFILLLLGMYETTINAIKNSDYIYLILFLIGAISGIIILTPLLKWLLNKLRDQVLAVLVGLMLGSSTALWPWNAELYNIPQLPDEKSLLIVPIIFLPLGIIITTLFRKMFSNIKNV